MLKKILFVLALVLLSVQVLTLFLVQILSPLMLVISGAMVCHPYEAESQTTVSESNKITTAYTTITVLEYHDFTNDSSKITDYTMSTKALRRDLEWLRTAGYTTVLPRELIAGRRDDGTPLPEKPVLLTFDDGYASNYTLAFPILQEYGAKATISLVTSRIDDETSGFLNWEQCRKMVSSGLIEFASHTHDYHIRDEVKGINRMTGETEAEYKARIYPDLQKSIDRIEAELNQTVTTFTYPLGNMDDWAEPFLREHFSVTLSGVYGYVHQGDSLYRLPRCNVSDKYSASEYVR